MHGKTIVVIDKCYSSKSLFIGLFLFIRYLLNIVAKVLHYTLIIYKYSAGVC